MRPLRITLRRLLILVLLAPSIVTAAAATAASVALNLLGVAPQDVSRYKSGGLFRCGDGSGSFTAEYLNDNFCDCSDGTDEPGTSACPNGRFYCNTQSQTPIWVFSSRVNDGICDCCDGSDEYDGQVQCKLTCLTKNIDRRLQGGGTSKKITAKYHKGRLRFSSWGGEEGGLKHAVYKLKDLKVLMLLEIVLLMLLMWKFFGRTCRGAFASRRQLPH